MTLKIKTLQYNLQLNDLQWRKITTLTTNNLITYITVQYNTITLIAIQLLNYGIYSYLTETVTYLNHSFIYSLHQLLTALNPTECAFSEGINYFILIKYTHTYNERN